MLQTTPIVLTFGTNFFINSNDLSTGIASDVPVTLFSDDSLLFTSPASTASVTAVNTIGISGVAFSAA